MTHKKRITWLISSMLLVAVLISTVPVGQASSSVLPSAGMELAPVPLPQTDLQKRHSEPLLQLNGDLPIVSLAASSQLWPVANAADGNLGTMWSSNTHTSATYSEWIAYWFGQFYSVNYIKLRPRYGTAATLSFPVDFTVYYSDGANWQPVYTYTAFPTPQRSDWIILRLPNTVSANGILVTATKLGKDDYNNYVLQFAEVRAGYDEGFNYFSYLGNNGVNLQNEIQNVGSGDFDPNKLSNWNYDIRRPLIAANPGTHRNIYGANIVLNGSPWSSHTWNIYYGGWDGSPDQFDRVSFLTTNDDFLTFSNHFLQIDHGAFEHVNNPSVQKIGGNQWLMYYTSWLGMGYPNKPAYSTSANGASWTPNSGAMNTRLTVNGYPYGWGSADVNGGNVLYYENGTYHLYFHDFTQDGPNHDQPRVGVFHATSSDGVNFTYQNTITGQKFIVNDLKPLLWAGVIKYYLLITYDLTQGADYSISTSLATPNPSTPRSEIFGPSTPLFTNMDANDRNMLSVGLVASNSRLYGALYGAVAGPPGTTCCTGAIYAKWLQKKVLFINDYVRWGDIERAYGPDRIKLFMLNQVETGRFYIYDTDGTTLLYTSPRVTIRSGDVWSYIDPLPPGIAVTPTP